KETNKPFVLNFYQKDLVTGLYSLYETTTIYYNTSHRTKIFEDNYDNAEYAQIFKGWSITPDTEVVIPEGGIIAVSEGSPYEQNYYTVYIPEKRTYKITFIDWDGDLLDEIIIPYGELPKPNNPTREETAQYFYDFDGWSPEIVAVTGDAVYTATYLATLRTYTVKWLNEDGTSLLEEDINVSYGTMPSYDGAIPTKPKTAQYTYTFAGWHIEISEVTGDIVYKATYTAEVNKYKVTWKNYDGTVLETDEKVPYGDMPEYNGSTPTKTATAQYTFVFAGWDTAVSEVTGDVVYTATYTNHIRSYTIKFVDYNGTTLKSESLEYGSMPTAPTPTRASTDQYTYTFKGWDSTVTNVVGDKTYKAQYTETVRYYTITWKVGSQTKTTSCVYGSTPTPPSGFEVGAKIVDGSNTYVISQWNVSTVTGATTYTAITSVIRSGTVTAYVSQYGARSNGLFGEPEYMWHSKDNYECNANTSKAYYYIQYYGMDFSVLQNKKNVQITGFEVFVRAGCMGVTSGKTTITGANLCTNLNTEQNTGDSYDTYTDLGDGHKYWINEDSALVGSTDYVQYKLSSNDFPNALDWMNNNIDKVISGINSGSFGIRIGGCYVNLKNLGMTLNYTYEE
ncbi:MAG: hypothetical protein J6Q79_03380, partial [Clostridia bacterium]|nr:hypothetical protein [Clostridia bacterium]